MFNNELYRELIGLNLLNDVMKERLFEVMTEFAEKEPASIMCARSPHKLSSFTIDNLSQFTKRL